MSGIDWAWFSTPQALAEGVWFLGAAFAVAIVTEWAKVGAQLVRSTSLGGRPRGRS